MKNDDFCHLHVHNEYSYLDGFGNVKNYVKRAKELEFNALACTNHGNIDGLIDFQKQCRDGGIISILGCEAYIVPNLSIKGKDEKRAHVTLLIKNQKGFENLCTMLSIANLQGFYKRPRIDYEILRQYCEGLIVLSGCSASFLLFPGGVELFEKLYAKIGGDLYLEIMPHDFEGQDKINQVCLDLDYPEVLLVGTNDCHYIEKEDREIQEVLLAIQTKAKWNDKKRFRFELDDLYLKTADEMLEGFKKINFPEKEAQESLLNTMDIVDKCKHFSISKKSVFLPFVPGYDNNPYSFLREITENKIIELSKKENWGRLKIREYKERLEEEWSLIQSKDFSQYFMIVWELIKWCKENDIMVGPGRGSAAGSLILYLLGITAVDSIKFGLLFSRFINEERIDFPDIDIDFEDKKRDKVREHLEKMYGVNNVASISTFLTMKGRAAIRDVCRVFDINQREVDEFAKSIGEEDGIEEALKEEVGKKFYQKHKKQVQIAIKLQGQKRGVSQHAAGVIVSAEDLRRGARGNLCLRSNNIVINWGMEDAEYMGLMKLDILGLNTLSILNEANKLIGGGIIFEEIPLDDLKVYKEISDGNNIGIFQLNTYSTSKLATEIKCKNIRELSDIIALVRPGPSDSGMTNLYIERKKKGWQSKKESMFDEIVKDTYGIIIYQEQIMKVIYEVAGLPYSVADKIRKVISKKREVKDFEPFKRSFIHGCLKRGIFSRRQAIDFWEMLQSHARYSFNLSHSISYAILAYQTAYMKKYYPTEFICANLTFGSEGKKEELIQEAYRLGLKIALPEIGKSEAKKWIVKDNILYIPFIEIKGVGEKIAIQTFEKIMVEKEPEKKKEIKNKGAFYEGFFFPRKEIKEKSVVQREAVIKKTRLYKLLEIIKELEIQGNSKELSKYFSFKIKLEKGE